MECPSKDFIWTRGLAIVSAGLVGISVHSIQRSGSDHIDRLNSTAPEVSYNSATEVRQLSPHDKQVIQNEIIISLFVDGAISSMGLAAISYSIEKKRLQNKQK